MLGEKYQTLLGYGLCYVFSPLNDGVQQQQLAKTYNSERYSGYRCIITYPLAYSGVNSVLSNLQQSHYIIVANLGVPRLSIERQSHEIPQ